MIAVVGDIHGRFHRVQRWLRELEVTRKRRISLVLSVGDIEAFRVANDDRRKASKRTMPAEFSVYASGERRVHRPMYFIAGNNEDFAALHDMPSGGTIAPGMHYLGRSGSCDLNGFNVAYLSGIYAPRYIEKPITAPTTLETSKQAGYFRWEEAHVLDKVVSADLLLSHEWPRGVVSRDDAVQRGIKRDFKAFRFPWVGNPVIRSIAERIKPQWLFCGHSHTAFTSFINHKDGKQTRVVCLDQATRPESAFFWAEWENSEWLCAGWGTSGRTVWRTGQPWDERCTPT